MTRHTTNARLVVGSGIAEPGTIFKMALRLADHGRSSGMALLDIRRSCMVESQSCYLRLRTPDGRIWHIRVSNHRRPLRSEHPVPHFDLVTIDGLAGLDAACGVIDRMITGELPWFEPEETIRRPRQRRKRRAR